MSDLALSVFLSMHKMVVTLSVFCCKLLYLSPQPSLSDGRDGQPDSVDNDGRGL